MPSDAIEPLNDCPATHDARGLAPIPCALSLGHVGEHRSKGGTTWASIEPLFHSDQLTVFLDATGRLAVYDGAGIIDVHRLDGIDRAAALDRLRAAIDADYARAVAERSVPNAD